ncbi:MAG: tetratricopeptide repeat protein [Candidatus Melainabacteria bacterium]|nr:tetratricopeptide repeat protein [Candidatus Melainabacteria bacterium]
MHLTGQIQNPGKPVRTKHRRLLVTSLVAALVLVSLPVIPMRLGAGGPIIVPDLSQLGDFVKFLGADLTAPKKSTATQKLAVKPQIQQTDLKDPALKGGVSVGRDKDKARGRLSLQVAGHLVHGESLMLSKQYWQAMQEFKSAIAADPAVALAHHQLGLAAALTDNTDMAIQEFREAVRLNPSDAIAHNNLGLACQATGEVNEAERQFRKAVTLKPELADAAINLANLHCLQRQYSKASQCLKEAVLQNPNSAIAHNNFAAVLSLQGNYREAVKEFHQSISLSPNMASAHYGLGLALIHLRKYLPAISELKRAVTLDPRLSSAYGKLDEAQRKVTLNASDAYGMN